MCSSAGEHVVSNGEGTDLFRMHQLLKVMLSGANMALSMQDMRIHVHNSQNNASAISFNSSFLLQAQRAILAPS